MGAVTALGGVSVVAPNAQSGLVADVQYFEQFGSAAFNRKAFGIFSAGVYRGYTVTPANGLNVTIGLDGDRPGVASVYVKNFQITVQLLTEQIVPLTAGKQNFVILEAVYGQGVLTRQVDSTVTQEAAILRVVFAESDIPANAIEIARITLEADAQSVTNEKIDTTKRHQFQVSFESTNDINDDADDRLLTVRAGKSFLPLSGGTVTGDLYVKGGLVAGGYLYGKDGAEFEGTVKTKGEFISTGVNTGANNLRMIGGRYGAIQRNDGVGVYLLATNADDAYGNYNSLRPFTMELASGFITLGHGAKVIGNFETTNAANLKGSLTVSGAAAFANSVNISGSLSVAKKISIGGSPTGNFANNLCSINIGDTDSGFMSPGDGMLDLYLNNAKYMGFDIANRRIYGEGEFITNQANGYRILSPNQGVIHRFDGSTYYLLFTDVGNQYGGWNGLRPFAVNASNGDVTLNHNVNIGNTLMAGGELQANHGNVRLAGDGNVYGSIWGGWISNWIQGNFVQRGAGDAVQDMRLAGEGGGVLNGTFKAPGGCVMTGWYTEGSSPGGDTIFYRAIQKCVNGNWYTIGQL